MLWNKDYERISEFRNGYRNEFVEKMEKALAYARGRVTNGYDKNEDEFIIIRVENYPCVAIVTNDFSPIEILTIVFPFDIGQVYPMQEIEEKVYFRI